jgi:hypothetical protein
VSLNSPQVAFSKASFKGTGGNQPHPLGKRPDGIVLLDQHCCHVAEASLIEKGKKVLFLELEVAIDVVFDGGDQVAELLPGGSARNVQRAIPGFAVDHFLQRVHRGKSVEVLLVQHAGDFG